MKNFKFLIKGKKYDVNVISLDGNVAKLKVNDEDYVVEIERAVKPNKTPIVVRSSVTEPHKEIEKKTGGPKTEIKSPLPGIIVKLFVKTGEQVSKNQKLFSLEAMKMENEIKAERDGVIAGIKVTEGQSVLQDEVIMEMN
jgi:glutaconyl-CoA/methylmalonyl-CoA decarboxylase subunit gamma